VTSDAVRPRLGAQDRSSRSVYEALRDTTLVYAEFHATMTDAIQREKRIEKWRRAWKIGLIERTNPSWRDLYDEMLK
jgi:predicted GIY-YIG superfamily endonuclease